MANSKICVKRNSLRGALSVAKLIEERARGGNYGGFGGNCPPNLMNRNIFINVRYFDLERRERNLIQFLIRSLFM